MWNLPEALAVIRILQTPAYNAGWNLHLGGGVLNQGESQNDLDILALGRFQLAPDEENLLAAALAAGWIKNPEPVFLPHRKIWTLHKNGRIIELILVPLP